MKTRVSSLTDEELRKVLSSRAKHCFTILILCLICVFIPDILDNDFDAESFFLILKKIFPAILVGLSVIWLCLDAGVSSLLTIRSAEIEFSDLSVSVRNGKKIKVFRAADFESIKIVNFDEVVVGKASYRKFIFICYSRFFGLVRKNILVGDVAPEELDGRVDSIKRLLKLPVKNADIYLKYFFITHQDFSNTSFFSS